MYKLYYLPGACSLATQVILRELDQEVTLVAKKSVSDYAAINPVGAVPVLDDDGHLVREGAAIILYLLEKHPSEMLPVDGTARHQAIEDLLFANATMHPAYGLLFFIAKNLDDGPAKDKAFTAAANQINHLWQIVENKLKDATFLGGDRMSAADILLVVFSNWGSYFPVEIKWGSRVAGMLEKLRSQPSFQAALAAEKADQA